MKDLVSKLVSNLHIMLLLYGLWIFYGQYEEHMTQMEAVETQFSPINEEIVRNTQKVKEIQDFIKKADEYRVRVEEVAKNIEAVQRQLPAETNDSTILGFFQKEMGNLNIKDPTLIPGAEEKNIYFVARDYSLKATGTFLQFLVFLERIGTADRIYNVRTLKLVVNNQAKKGRFQTVNGEVMIQAYRFNPEFKVDRGFDSPATRKP